ncbi:MAG: L,D-transpeptidase family protein, partial [Candidatus Hydrogenedentes bacterium]|nr:L,D-transpeptidase family protein [Candidatus Hydrogenedentota bacterium]
TLMLLVAMALSMQWIIATDSPVLQSATAPETVVEHSAGDPLVFAPLDPMGMGTFEASDALIEQPWRQASDAIAPQSKGGLFDALYRPRGPFWGDASLLCRSYFWLSADPALGRAELATVFHPRYAPDLNAPEREHTPLAEYSLLWPSTLANYYHHTGDRAYTEAMAAAVLNELFNYFDRYRAPSGLLQGVDPDGGFRPWPEHLRRGFDYEIAAKGENAVLNAFYYHALDTAAELAGEIGLPATEFRGKAQAHRRAFNDRLLDGETGLYFDAPGSTAHSVAGNGLALCFGLAPPESVAKIIALIRERGTDCAPEFAPYMVEACFKAGEPRLGYDMITFLNGDSAYGGPIYLIAEYVAGLSPAGPGWTRAVFSPRFPKTLASAKMSVPIQGGRATVRHARNQATTLTLPLGTRVEVDAREGDPVMVKNAVSHTKGKLTEEQWASLKTEGWPERVGTDAAVWVSVSEQMLRYIQGKDVLYQARCASSASGVGAVMNSLQTPLGWHSVVHKVGEDAPWGQVFRARQPTREIWQPGEDTTEDLVLTRILLLTGEEAGKNKGGDVDSYARNIYIHGTNDEARVGTPSSHGCIRLTNDDVIDAFRHIPKNTPVLITEF